MLWSYKSQSNTQRWEPVFTWIRKTTRGALSHVQDTRTAIGLPQLTLKRRARIPWPIPQFLNRFWAVVFRQTIEQTLRQPTNPSIESACCCSVDAINLPDRYCGNICRGWVVRPRTKIGKSKRAMISTIGMEADKDVDIRNPEELDATSREMPSKFEVHTQPCKI